MLVHLHVKNLALIEETEVEFGPGLNILTGETGAGKSILLGSIQLILGGKTSRSMIRENASYALVELLFQVENSDEAQNAVDHRIADGDQRILAAGRNARQDIGQPLLENTHRGTSCYLLIAMSKPRTACIGYPARPAWTRR